MLQIRGRLDLGQEPLGSHDCSELGLQDLQGDFALMLQVVGQVDGGHPTLTQLTLDGVAAFESGVQAGDSIGHGGQDASQVCGAASARGPKAQVASQRMPARLPGYSKSGHHRATQGSLHPSRRKR